MVFKWIPKTLKFVFATEEKNICPKVLPSVFFLTTLVESNVKHVAQDLVMLKELHSKQQNIFSEPVQAFGDLS